MDDPKYNNHYNLPILKTQYEQPEIIHGHNISIYLTGRDNKEKYNKA